ncbi:MAG: J domain-containing protein, partial [Pseudomonadota bacterium]|nr:J domain-containing protein [Pseudomonadota bacterium]
MDRLLAWLAGREGPASDLITAEFSARSLGETESKRLALSALDDYLFGEGLSDPLSVLGLDDGSDQGAIKNRYRRLMQVYHPDRAVVHGDWLTSRAETINQAYSRLNRQVHRNGRSRPYENGVRPAARAKPSYRAKTGKGVYPAPQDKFHLRKSLGSAQKFQREVLITLVVVSVLLLGLIYISSRDTGIPPREKAPTVDLGAERKLKTGVEDSIRPESSVPEQSSASSTPAGDRLPAAVEQPESVMEKAAEVHVKWGAGETAIDIRDSDQKSAGLESVTVPEGKEGRAESAEAGKETEQEGA